MMNKTKNISKRAKIIILAVFEFYVISSRAAEYILRSRGSEVTDKTDGDKSLLAIFIALSLFYLILAWFMERLIKYYATRTKRERWIFTWEVWTLILTYMFFYVPTLFGDMLVGMGLPLTQFVYFVATTVVMALIWGIYDLRKSSILEPVQ